MATTMVIETTEQRDAKVRVLTVLAFAAIYIVWGSTFFAIRVAVSEIPPLQAAGLRFAIAGVLLFVWARMRGAAMPTRLEWRNTGILAVFMFLIDYAFLFWGEKTVPSGVASVLVAVIPIWTTVFEVFVFEREHWNARLLLAVAAGLGGVVLLTRNTAAQHAALLPCLGILVSGVSWAIGTGLSKSLSTPSSKPLNASMQMMIGGALLLFCSLPLGERLSISEIHWDALIALAYLIFAGSIVAFTAYVWLLARFPATKVASYAYVNPVVALVIGSWLGNETVNWETFVAAGLILASVATILRSAKPVRTDS
jgi:drug/metabolite transporter (DMT)-like permease